MPTNLRPESTRHLATYAKTPKPTNSLMQPTTFHQPKITTTSKPENEPTSWPTFEPSTSQLIYKPTSPQSTLTTTSSQKQDKVSRLLPTYNESDEPISGPPDPRLSMYKSTPLHSVYMPVSPKSPVWQISKKHFTKMQKHVGLASTKNQPNKMGLT